MSVKVMAWVWEHSKSKSTARLVLLAIADCANDTGADAYPSTAKLAAKTALSERGVRGAVADLERLGELKTDYKAGPKGCNRYRVIMRDPEPAAGNPAPPAYEEQTRNEVHSAPPAGSTRNSVPGTRHETTRNPARRAPEPSEPSSTSLEPSVAQKIIGEWIDRCPKRPPERVIGPMAKQIAALLAESIDPNDIRRGIAAWMAKPDAHPSILPSVVNGVMNGARASPRRSTGDERGDEARAAGRAVSAMLGTQREITR